MKIGTMICIFLFIGTLVFAQENDGQPKFKLTVGKELLVFDEPLLDDGRIDYITAMNQRDANKVASNENAFRELLLLVDLESIDEPAREQVKELHGALDITQEELAGSQTITYWLQFAEARGLDFDVALDIEEQVHEMDFTHDQIGVYQQWIKAQTPALNAAADACRLPGYWQPLLESPDRRGSGMIEIMPPLAGFRQTVLALKYRAYFAIHNGNHKRAASDALAIRHYASHLKQGPFIIHAVIGSLYDHYASDVARALIEHAGANHDAVALLVSGWRKTPESIRYHDLMHRDETVFSLNWYMGYAAKKLTLDDPELYLAVDDSAVLEQAIDHIGVDLDALVRRVRVYVEAEAKRLSAKTYAESIELSHQYDKTWEPRKQALRDNYLFDDGENTRIQLPDLEIGPSELARLIVDLSNAIESSLAFDFDVGRTEFIHLARRAVGDTAMACAGYFSKHGTYPGRLSQLVPDFLDKVPTDPIDGKPLRYRRNDDGSAVVYSVYFDLDDDGGLNDSKDSETLDEGDYCWHLPAIKR